MTPQPIWNEEVRINHVEGDYYGRWKLSSLFVAMQEAAARHAIAMGWGYDELQALNLAWMLVRFKVRFATFPLAGERVRVQTWPKGIRRKIFFGRDFLILAEDGDRVYARATSDWLLTDTRTRRMQRPGVLPLDIPSNEGLSALDEPLDRISVTGELHEQFCVQARASMLDLMGHVTSARYLEWVADCFPVEAYQDDALAWLQVNFIQEVRPGESVSVRCGRSAEQGATWFVQGINPASGAAAFDAALGFREQ
jgi:medium-chain acyl-[acyl-carrier-protein] hydrolase